MDNGFRSGNPAWSPDGNWIAYSVVEVDAWPNPANGFNLIFGDSTIYVIDTKGNDDGQPLEETTGLSSDHVPVWTSENFFPVSPDESKQILTWGKLKNLIRGVRSRVIHCASYTQLPRFVVRGPRASHC